METMTQKQTKFVLAFVGGQSLVAAGRQAGYKGDQVYQAIKSTSVTTAIIMLEELHQLDYGIAVAKKREMLMGLAQKDPHEDI